MPPKDNKDKNKGKSKAKSKVKSKPKSKGAGSLLRLKPRAKRRTKKAKHVSRAPFIIVIILLLAVIAFLLLRKTDSGQPPPPVADKRASAEKSDAPVEKKTKLDEAKTNEVKTEEAKAGEANKKSNVQVWFLRFDEKTENVSLTSVQRNVSDDGKIENALKALIEGPSAGEKSRGYLTAVPPNLSVRSVKIKNRVAEIDFNAAIGEAAAGNILMNRIDQIIYTATQFKEIDGIVISVNGKKQSVIGGDGLSIHGVLNRK